MRRVYQYPIQITDHQRIVLPKGAGIIHADMGIIQALGYGPTPGHMALCLWAMVDDAQREMVEVDIYIASNGDALPFTYGQYGAWFLRTVLDGKFVWHLFYRTAHRTAQARAVEQGEPVPDDE